MRRAFSCAMRRRARTVSSGSSAWASSRWTPWSSEFEAVRKLMAKYASVPMSLADACLVRMTELPTRAAVVTLDGELRVYRRNGRQVLPVIMPD
jgi:hypothetical protein